MSITVTSLLHEFVSSHWADLVFHDLAGWLMMSLALALLGAEAWLLSLLLMQPLPEDSVAFSFGTAEATTPETVLSGDAVLP